jgi:hypothetical protein
LATPTWRKTYGFHPLLCFLDRPDIASGEALAGIVREGRAGSNTTADHITVLDMALASLPAAARPGATKTGAPDAPRLVVRADAAGATHGFATACRERKVGFSVGFGISEAVRVAITTVPAAIWCPAIETDGAVREGAWLAEVTELVDLSAWPAGSRLIVRKERPIPAPSCRSSMTPKACATPRS